MNNKIIPHVATEVNTAYTDNGTVNVFNILKSSMKKCSIKDFDNLLDVIL